MNQQGGLAPSGRLRDWAGAISALVWMLGVVAILPCEATAQTLTVDETVALVRAVHFEGIPEEEAMRVGPDGAARLVEMLRDPAEAATHANVLIVLGLCGQPGSFEAIDAWASLPLSGEIDRDRYRAWQALPYAFGHVARFDRRAIAALEAQLSGEVPGWTFRHHRGARLHRQSRRAAAMALGSTGLPEAAQALERASRGVTDVEFDEHLREVRVLHGQRAGERRSR